MPSTGRKTTEFWMFLFSGVVLLANGTSIINVPWDQFVVWMTAWGVYTGARTWEKVTAHKTNGAANA